MMKISPRTMIIILSIILLLSAPIFVGMMIRVLHISWVQWECLLSPVFSSLSEA